ncbi:MAG: hypothetical protein GY822_00065 [Deltaproteobacteria bacterium]|nr:hypothetical protein [Deltaproteobacteria bacterium]
MHLGERRAGDYLPPHERQERDGNIEVGPLSSRKKSMIKTVRTEIHLVASSKGIVLAGQMWKQ